MLIAKNQRSYAFLDVVLAAGVVEFGDNASSPLNLYMLSYSTPA
jgi:hypothetical protein